MTGYDGLLGRRGPPCRSRPASRGSPIASCPLRTSLTSNETRSTAQASFLKYLAWARQGRLRGGQVGHDLVQVG